MVLILSGNLIFNCHSRPYLELEYRKDQEIKKILILNIK